MMIGPGQSDIHGRFVFRARTDEIYVPTWSVAIRVPVLVPVSENGSEIVLANHWKLGRSEKAEKLRPVLFEMAKPKIVAHGRAIAAKDITVRLILPSERRGALGRAFHGGDGNYSCAAIDGRYAIAEFTFETPIGDPVHGAPVEIGYRQFHANITTSYPEARYVPFFVSLPPKTNPTTNPAYQIRVAAGPGAGLELASHNVIRSQRNSEYVIAPQDRKPIVVRVLLAPAAPRS